MCSYLSAIVYARMVVVIIAMATVGGSILLTSVLGFVIPDLFYKFAMEQSILLAAINVLTAARERGGVSTWSLGLCLILLVGVICLVTVSSSQSGRQLAFARVGPRDIACVLPLVLDQRLPFAMVSYAWLADSDPRSGPRRLIARSLAASLPNCWVDTQMMASGTCVSTATTAVAAGCHVLIILLSKEYMM